MLQKRAHLGDVVLCDLVTILDQLEVMIDISEGKLEHFKDELVTFGDKSTLFLLQRGETRGIHMSQGIDVVCPSELGINMHDELSLFLELLAIQGFLLLKVLTCLIGGLYLLHFAHSSLYDLVFEDDALFQFFSSLCQSFLRRSVVSLIVSTLLVKLEFQRARHISLQRQHIKVRVLFHQIC